MSRIKTVLYKSKVLKNGQSPVMLYLYQHGKTYRIGLHQHCMPFEWDDRRGRYRRNVRNNAAKNRALAEYENRAEDILDEFARGPQRFDIDLFKKKFNGEDSPEQGKLFYEFFGEYIARKEEKGKHGTAKNYSNAFHAMVRYKKKDFPFSELNYELLKGLEHHLERRGCSPGGIGSYMRPIRAVYYEGMRMGYVSQDQNPYSTVTNRNGYSLAHLKSPQNPRAMTAEQLARFKEFDIEKYHHLADAWRYFMFSFWMLGINFVDICNLKRNNVQDGRLRYERQKTKKPFDLQIRPEAQAIIDHYRSDSEYVFPFYNENIHKTSKQQATRKHRVMRETNRDLREIAEILGIEGQFTFYTARHTAATTLKRNGVSVEVISEALGHANPAITQSYLSSFDTSVVDGAIQRL